MNTNSMFEFATRNKIRFSSPRGELSVEALWDVPLRSKDGFDLNTVAKASSKALKAISEENFVETTKTAEHSRLEAAMSIVEHVIETKLDEEAAAKTRADNRAKKATLLQALAEKQAGKLSAMSEKELQKQINELEV